MRFISRLAGVYRVANWISIEVNNFTQLKMFIKNQCSVNLNLWYCIPVFPQKTRVTTQTQVFTTARHMTYKTKEVSSVYLNDMPIKYVYRNYRIIPCGSVTYLTAVLLTWHPEYVPGRTRPYGGKQVGKCRSDNHLKSNNFCHGNVL